MLISTAHLATEHASKYLQQLCKHFSHKIDVQFDSHHAKGQLSPGPFDMHADETGLTINVSGQDARAVIEARYVVDKHLVTFAFRENFCGMPWQAPTPAPSQE